MTMMKMKAGVYIQMIAQDLVDLMIHIQTGPIRTYLLILHQVKVVTQLG